MEASFRGERKIKTPSAGAKLRESVTSRPALNERQRKLPGRKGTVRGESLEIPRGRDSGTGGNGGKRRGGRLASRFCEIVPEGGSLERPTMLVLGTRGGSLEPA